MQYVYAYQQCKKSDLQLALDLIDEYFQPDLNSMEVQDKTKLNAQKKLAQDIFSNHYESTQLIQVDTEIDTKVRRSVETAIKYYHQQVKKDADRLQGEIMGSIEALFDTYLLLMQLLVDLADFVEVEYVERQKRTFSKSVIVFEHELKLKTNKLVERIRQYEAFQAEVSRRNLKWNPDLVRQWFKLLQKDEAYQNYRNLATTDFEGDTEIVNHILKNFILKNDIVESYLEERDISWAENKSILRSMTTKTLKSLVEDTALALYELSPNWEEDKEFFKDLFSHAIKDLGKYEGLIAEKTANWDVERITTIDKILLEMALSEMAHFPSIPIKVTINEYLELSKIYSTPKSNTFINGVLDNISQELIEAGKIKKSGRGLLDNQ
jgi:transcription antitermination protein NusB